MTGTARRKRRPVFSAPVRRGLWIGGTIFLTAAAIVVFGALSTPKTATDSARPSASVPGLQAYTDGMAALAAGETTRALELLRMASAVGNVQAAERLVEISAKSPSVTTTATPGAAPTDEALSQPVADVASLLPASMVGYAAANVEKSPDGAIRAFEPTRAGPFGKVTLVVMSVLDKGSEEQARAYVDQITRAYPANAESVSVGSRQGRFGTDGSHLAAVSFSRGRYAFEVVSTASRPDPSLVRAITIAAAAAFPAAQ